MKRRDIDIMAKKKVAEKALNVDNILFNCRDILRAARNSGCRFCRKGKPIDRLVYGRQYYTRFIYQKTNRVQTG